MINHKKSESVVPYQGPNPGVYQYESMGSIKRNSDSEGRTNGALNSSDHK